MERKKSREAGVITIEATISLTSFMFVIVTILTIVNICIVQTRIGIAIHGVAKEISHYSYLYSLTGINGSHAAISDASEETKKTIDGAVDNVNTVFTEIQNLGKSAGEIENPEDVDAFLTQLESSYNNAANAGGALKETITDMASDPKKVAFGLLKIGANDGLNKAGSMLAEFLAKALCQKNLVSQKGGDVDAYLSSLGVVPSANGSYLDGLDFSKSSLFKDGSNEIRINVSYGVKVIALLPIDFTFQFNQTAVTQGWLAGEDSYRTTQAALEATANNNIWNQGTTAERSDLIRHQGIAEMKEDGYKQTTGLTDVQLYNEQEKEFVAIYSMNPLYSPEGDETKTLDDINKDVIKEQIEYICGSMVSTTEGKTRVQVKTTKKDGSTEKKEYDCANASNKIVLVIPQDEGLDDLIESIIKESECRGVTIEIQKAYGNGARTTVVENSETTETTEGDKGE